MRRSGSLIVITIRQIAEIEPEHPAGRRPRSRADQERPEPTRDRAERLWEPVRTGTAGVGELVLPTGPAADRGRRVGQHGRSRRARAIASGVAAATSIAFPPVPLPTTTTAGRSCSRSRILIASSRSSPGSRSGTSVVTSATPSISPCESARSAISWSAPARPQFAEAQLRRRLFSSRTSRARWTAARGSLASKRADEVADTARARRSSPVQRVGSDERLDPPHAGAYSRPPREEPDHRDRPRCALTRAPAAELTRVVLQSRLNVLIEAVLLPELGRLCWASAPRPSMSGRSASTSSCAKRSVRLQLRLFEDLDRHAALGCEKSNRSRPGSINRARPPRVLAQDAAQGLARITWVEVCARAVPSRNRRSISAIASCPGRISPDSTTAPCTIARSPAFWASSTRTVPVWVRITPWSPT